MWGKIAALSFLIVFCSENALENEISQIKKDKYLSSDQKIESLIKLVLSKKVKSILLKKNKIILEYGNSTPLFFQNSKSYQDRVKTEIAHILLKVFFITEFSNFEEITISLIKPFYIKNTETVADFEVFRVNFHKKYLDKIFKWNEISPLTDFSKNREKELIFRKKLNQVELYWTVELDLLNRIELEEWVR